MKKYTRSQVERVVDTAYTSGFTFGVSKRKKMVHNIMRLLDKEVKDKSGPRNYVLSFNVMQPNSEFHMIREVEDVTSVDFLTEEALEFVKYQNMGVVKFELESVKEDK